MTWLEWAASLFFPLGSDGQSVCWPRLTSLGLPWPDLFGTNAPTGLLVCVLMGVRLLDLVVVVGGSDRALGLADFDHSSSSYSGPCCLYRLCIMPSCSCTALGLWRLFLVALTPQLRLWLCEGR